jgi:hypothetical protein
MENNPTPQNHKWKINLFDVVIIVLVLIAAILFLYFTTFRGQSVSNTESTVTYTMELRDISKPVADAIQIGDTLTDSVKNNDLGTIQSVEIVPYTTLGQITDTGEYVLSVVPDRYTAILEMEAAAVESDTSIAVGAGYIIRCGTSVSVIGPGYIGTGTILTIERGN